MITFHAGNYKHKFIVVQREKLHGEKKQNHTKIRPAWGLLQGSMLVGNNLCASCAIKAACVSNVVCTHAHDMKGKPTA